MSSAHRVVAPTPADFAAIFEDDKRGAAIFEHLVQRFGRAPPDDTDGIGGILKTYKHAGQRSVIDFIVTQINLHNRVEEPTHEIPPSPPHE